MSTVPIADSVPVESAYGGEDEPSYTSFFGDVAQFLAEQRASQEQRPWLYVVSAQDLEEEFPTVRPAAAGNDTVRAPKIASGAPHVILRPVLQAGNTVLRPLGRMQIGNQVPNSVLQEYTRASDDIEPTGASLLRFLRDELLVLRRRTSDDTAFQLLIFTPGDERPQRFDGRLLNPEWTNFKYRSGVASVDLAALLEKVDEEEATEEEDLNINPLLLEWQRRLDAQPARDSQHFVYATPITESELSIFRASERVAESANIDVDEPQDCLLYAFDDAGLVVAEDTYSEFGRRLGSQELGVDLTNNPALNERILRSACLPPNIFYTAKDDDDDARPTGCYAASEPVQVLPAVCACLNLLRTAPAVGMATFARNGADRYRGEYPQRFAVDSRRELTTKSFDSETSLERAPCPPANGCPDGWSTPQCSASAMCFKPDYSGPTALRDFAVDALRIFGPKKRIALIYYPGTCAREQFDAVRDVQGDALDLINDDSLLPKDYRQQHAKAMNADTRDNANDNGFGGFTFGNGVVGDAGNAGDTSGKIGGGDNGGRQPSKPAPENKQDKESGLPAYAIGLIAGSVLLLILIIVAVLVARRNPEQMQRLRQMIPFPRRARSTAFSPPAYM